MKYILVFLLIAFSSQSLAAPYIDKLTICYEFKNDKLIDRQPCVKSSGHGTGEQYIHYSFGKKNFSINIDTTHPVETYKLNDQKAISYSRDAYFLNIHKGKHLENLVYLDCYTTKDGKIDICAFHPHDVNK